MASVHAGHGEQFKRPMLPMDLVPAKRGRFENGGPGQALVAAGGPQQNQVPRLSNLQVINESIIQVSKSNCPN